MDWKLQTGIAQEISRAGIEQKDKIVRNNHTTRLLFMSKTADILDCILVIRRVLDDGGKVLSYF